MSIFSKLFRKSEDKQPAKAGGMEDFMLLIRVYYQAVMASQIGINNLGALPDLRIFKQTYHVATLNNKLGIAEKKHCRKLMQDIYGISDGFFSEIDGSIRKHCRKIQDAQSYLIQFQGFSQDLMMLMGNLMQWKMRLPSFFRGALREMTAKQVHQVLTKNDWKDEGVRKACVSVRNYQALLGYTDQWMTEHEHTNIMLAKKEPKKNSEQ